MNEKWKTDYVEEILDYDDRVAKYMDNKRARVFHEHIENINDQT